MSDSSLIKLTATEAVNLLARKEVSPRDLLQASIDRINEVDPLVNAMPIKCFERAFEALSTFEQNGDTRHPGWLGGLPISVKDLEPVADVPFTYGGSGIYKDHVAPQSSSNVVNLEHRGAVVVGKSNSPEWGFNASTINELFGPTRNPYDLKLTVGGSSGGAAASVATGEVWAATGSDLGSSIRLPAAFCGVVGLRPTPGRIPHVPTGMPFNSLPVLGPIARTVEDVALFFESMAAFDWRDPLSFPSTPGSFVDNLDRFDANTTFGWSPDLNVTPVSPAVLKVANAAIAKLASSGIRVDDANIDCSMGRDVFHAIRGVGHLANMTPLVEQYGDAVIPEVRESLERAKRLSIDQYAWGAKARGKLLEKFIEYFEGRDILICPAAVMEPFPAEWRRVDELGDHRFDSYIDWIAITYTVSLTGFPVLSLPCGLTERGLPVGLQLIARPKHEAQLLAVGKRCQEILGALGKDPVTPVATN